MYTKLAQNSTQWVHIWSTFQKTSKSPERQERQNTTSAKKRYTVITKNFGLKRFLPDFGNNVLTYILFAFGAGISFYNYKGIPMHFLTTK